MGIFNRTRHKSASAPGALPAEATKPDNIVIRRVIPGFLRGDYTMRNSDLIFSATSRISNAFSAMPVQLYKGTKRIKNHPLSDLVGIQPNPNMTACQFFKTMEACRCTYGNAYALKLVNKKMQVTRLDVLDPDRVRPFLDEDSNELWYEITPSKGKTLLVHNYYVLHLPFISTNGYSGINPVSVLFDTLQYQDSIRKFSVAQLDKGVNASIVLEAPGNLGEEQQKRVIKDLLSAYKETGGDIVLLESGVTARALNLSPVDTKLFEVEKITRGQVAMVYNLPPHMLGDYSDTSFSTMEQQTLEFLTLTMLPIVTGWEQECNRKLLTDEKRRNGYHFRIDMDAILRADAQTMADVYQKAIRGGWKKPNEVREAYGDPEDPNGNELMGSRDLAPLSYLVQSPELYNSGGKNQNARQNDPDDGAEPDEPPVEAGKKRKHGR